MTPTVSSGRVLHFIVYIIMCLSHRHAPIQIAFGIMVYQRSEQNISVAIADFDRLMSHIYEDEFNHVYVLHIDYKSDPLLRKHLNEYCTLKSNCISIDSRSVTWGGISVTEMNLALMQAADDYLYPDGRSSSWEYFFLVGHESTPLTTLKYTEQFLLSYPKGTNFINCWKANGYNFFGQRENVMHRLSRVVVDSPVDNVLHEIDLGRGVPDGINVYKSLQYVVLSREFVRYSGMRWSPYIS